MDTENTPAYRIELKVKNNLLLARMKERGIKNASHLARLAGVYPNEVGQMLNLQMTVYTSRMEMRSAVSRVLDFLGVSADEAFPSEVHFQRLLSNKGHVAVGSEELARLTFMGEGKTSLEHEDMIDAVRKITSCLPNRNKKALGMHFDGATFGEIGSELGVNAERARQIVLHSVRKCRSSWAAREIMRLR